MTYKDSLGNIQYVMVNSGKADASSRGDMKTQTLSAHFPMLFHRDPRKVMVLGLASGVTAGEVLHYPVDQLDVIDISEQVVKASDYFIPWNNNVLSDPRTNLIIQDGRAHLNLTREKYDVIISEPSNPWMAGLATLFTRDTFSLARERLNEDGIFLQFIHSYQMDWASFALVGRSFAQVFPNSLLLLTRPSGIGNDYLLVGFKGKERLNLDYARQKISYAGRSKNISLSDPRLMYRLIMTEDLHMLFGKGPVNTDKWPLLEYAAPKLIHHEDLEIFKTVQSKRWLRGSTQEIIRQVRANVDSQIDFVEYALSIYEPFPAMVDLKTATPLQKGRFFKLMDEYCAKNVLNLFIFKDDELKRRLRSVLVRTIEDKIDHLPYKAIAYSFLGHLYSQEKMYDKSMVNFQKALAIKPDLPVIHFDFGLFLDTMGRSDEAVIQFNEALRLDPFHEKAHKHLGRILVRQGRTDEAIAHFKSALQISPRSSDTHTDLGKAFHIKGDVEEAVTHLKTALQIRPDMKEPHYRLVRILLGLGREEEAVIQLKAALNARPDWIEPMNSLARILAAGRKDRLREPVKAIRLAERVCELTEFKRPDLLDTLAVAYAAGGRFPEAVDTAKKAIELARSAGQEKLAEEIRDRMSLYKAG
ncbi:MAG: tetratricopeptide repeat protein, partial [Deltaproteobacteria bacterium]|nr:tetratricopeptide repeat protein [Deltaproteobacteria bacterium]